MQLFSMLPDRFTRVIADRTNLTITKDYSGPEVISIIIRRYSQGGTDDPTAYLKNPRNCIVIAGTPDETGNAFAEKSVQAGVPKENIYMIPRGQSITPDAITEKIEQIKQNILSSVDNADEDVFNFTFDEPAQAEPVSNLLKVIAVRGFRGGVGTTTIATSLATQLADSGGKIALVDLGLPPNAKLHGVAEKLTKNEGFLTARGRYWNYYAPPVPVWKLDADRLDTLIDNLRKEYRWVVVDLCPQPDNRHLKAVKQDRTIVVVDSDIIQSVYPCQDDNIKDALYVYNKAIPSLQADIIEDFLECTLVEIKTDYEGCYAALAAREPACRKSEEIAAGIGALAAKLTPKY